MTRIVVLLCIQTIVVAGCSLLARASDPPPGTAAPIESMTPPEATEKPRPPVDREIEGILGFEDIEGGCWYLETADGSRYQVIYPEGWSIDSATAGPLPWTCRRHARSARSFGPITS